VGTGAPGALTSSSADANALIRIRFPEAFGAATGFSDHGEGRDKAVALREQDRSYAKGGHHRCGILRR